MATKLGLGSFSSQRRDARAERCGRFAFPLGVAQRRGPGHSKNIHFHQPGFFARKSGQVSLPACAVPIGAGVAFEEWRERNAGSRKPRGSRLPATSRRLSSSSCVLSVGGYVSIVPQTYDTLQARHAKKFLRFDLTMYVVVCILISQGEIGSPSNERHYQ
jgi:hypothetical protein